VISFAESAKTQDKTEEMGIIDIDSWIHQQIIENTGICHSERMLDITEVNEYETYNSSTASPVQKEMTNGSKLSQDEDSDLNLPTQNVEDIKETKALNQFTRTELYTPPSKELCSNVKMKEHKNEKLAFHGSCSRRSLQEELGNWKPEQPNNEPKAVPNMQPENKFHDNEHHIGTFC